MTDHAFDRSFSAPDRTDGRTGRRRFPAPRSGGLFRDLFEDFRAVPAEAWIILAVATVMSNLFIALA